MASHNRFRTLVLLFLVSSCLLCVAPVPAIWAQTAGTPASLLTFPHFVAYQDVSTGIAIVNPNLLQATVTLTLTDWDGQVLVKPVTLTIPARTQVTKTSVPHRTHRCCMR